LQADSKATVGGASVRSAPEVGNNTNSKYDFTAGLLPE